MFSIGIQGNPDEYRREMDALGQRLLPKAMASMVNNAAFKSRDLLIAHTASVMDKPKPFTQRAWKVEKANPAQGDAMKAVIKAQDTQAKYLYWTIMGGTRSPGDAGTGRYDILFWSRRKTAQGGAYNKTSFNKIADEHKQERRGRRSWKAMTGAARASHSNSIGPIARDLRWVGRPDYKSGLFHGTIGGVEGYYQRPDRLTAVERFQRYGKNLQRHNDDVGRANALLARGRLSSAKQRIQDAYGREQRGEIPRLADVPWVKPGSKPKLLLAFRRTTEHRPFVDYDGQIFGAYNSSVNAAELGNTLRFLKNRSRP